MRERTPAMVLVFIVTVPIMRIIEQFSIDLFNGSVATDFYLAIVFWSLLITTVAVALTWKVAVSMSKSFWCWTVFPTLIATGITFFNAHQNSIPYSDLIGPAIMSLFFWMLSFVPAWFLCWKVLPSVNPKRQRGAG